jgi:hypothetical protein
VHRPLAEEGEGGSADVAAPRAGPAASAAGTEAAAAGELAPSGRSVSWMSVVHHCLSIVN